VRMSRSASVSECECLEVQVSWSASLKARGPKAQGPKAPGPKVLVFVCLYERCRRPRAWRRARAPVSALAVVPATKSRDGSSWMPTEVQGGTASEMQLDSAHRTTGVVCRLFSRQRGGGGAG